MRHHDPQEKKKVDYTENLAEMEERKGDPLKIQKLLLLPAEEKNLPRAKVKGQRKAGRKRRMKGLLIVRIKEEKRRVSGECITEFLQLICPF